MFITSANIEPSDGGTLYLNLGRDHCLLGQDTTCRTDTRKRRDHCTRMKITRESPVRIITPTPRWTKPKPGQLPPTRHVDATPNGRTSEGL